LKIEVNQTVKTFVITTFALLLLIFLAGEISACDCAGQTIPCQAYGQASAVFLGTVINSRIVTTKRGEFESQSRVVRMSIDTSFRGVEGGEVEVTTGLGGGDCGFGFQQSRQYLVYAYEYEGKLGTGICSRTRLASNAGEDLQYLRSSAKNTTGGSISGGVFKARRNEHGGTAYDPLAGVAVFVDGPKNARTKTDTSGKYRLENFPPGDYIVKLSMPEGLSTRGEPEEKVKLVDYACGVASFWLEPDGQLSGRVLNPQGLPVNKAEIFISEADKERYQGYFESAYSDEDGRYRFKQVPPGRYVLAIRFDGMTGQQRPFPQTYVPGVGEKSQATVISLKEGQKIDAYDLQMPPLPLESEIEGQVLWSDGKPAADARVGYSGGEPVLYGAAVDKDGRFRFKAYNDLKISLSASVEPEKGKYIQSNNVTILVGPGLEPVKLILPRP
jgi:hypothetical protein